MNSVKPAGYLASHWTSSCLSASSHSYPKYPSSVPLPVSFVPVLDSSNADSVSAVSKGH